MSSPTLTDFELMIWDSQTKENVRVDIRAMLLWAYEGSVYPAPAYSFEECLKLMGFGPESTPTSGWLASLLSGISGKPAPIPAEVTPDKCGCVDVPTTAYHYNEKRHKRANAEVLLCTSKSHCQHDAGISRVSVKPHGDISQAPEVYLTHLVEACKKQEAKLLQILDRIKDHLATPLHHINRLMMDRWDLEDPEPLPFSFYVGRESWQHEHCYSCILSILNDAKVDDDATWWSLLGVWNMVAVSKVRTAIANIVRGDVSRDKDDIELEEISDADVHVLRNFCLLRLYALRHLLEVYSDGYFIDSDHDVSVTDDNASLPEVDDLDVELHEDEETEDEEEDDDERDDDEHNNEEHDIEEHDGEEDQEDPAEDDFDDFEQVHLPTRSPSFTKWHLVAEDGPEGHGEGVGWFHVVFDN